ncbi:MAG: Rrf2 family transcriptional regulator [Planctomycetaceae bacterium]|jgi:Rrf2 family protein|nr:Rrf2 family transcriptional regulator [Planctomycetaceae bacterium]
MSLKISAKTEYACIAIMDLAIHINSAEPVRIRNIAERHSVPPRFLVQILLQLKSADIVESTRGATGGYRLKKRPEDVTLGQVMNIIDAPVNNGKRTLNQTNTESGAAIILGNIWNDAEKCRQDFLNNITFADLIQRASENNNPLCGF